MIVIKGWDKKYREEGEKASSHCCSYQAWLVKKLFLVDLCGYLTH